MVVRSGFSDLGFLRVRSLITSKTFGVPWVDRKAHCTRPKPPSSYTLQLDPFESVLLVQTVAKCGNIFHAGATPQRLYLLLPAADEASS